MSPCAIKVGYLSQIHASFRIDKRLLDTGLGDCERAYQRDVLARNLGKLLVDQFLAERVPATEDCFEEVYELNLNLLTEHPINDANSTLVEWSPL